MNLPNGPLLAIGVVAVLVILAVFGSAISQVGGAVGGVASDSLSQLIAVFGLPTVLLAAVIGIVLFISLRGGGPPRRGRR